MREGDNLLYRFVSNTFASLFLSNRLMVIRTVFYIYTLSCISIIGCNNSHNSDIEPEEFIDSIVTHPENFQALLIQNILQTDTLNVNNPQYDGDRINYNSTVDYLKLFTYNFIYTSTTDGSNFIEQTNGRDKLVRIYQIEMKNNGDEKCLFEFEKSPHTNMKWKFVRYGSAFNPDRIDVKLKN